MEEASGREEPEEPEAEAPSGGRPGLLARLRQGLSKTRQGFVHKVDRILFGRKEIDAQTLEELEEALVTADLGVHTSTRLIAEIQERVSRKELTSPEALREHLKQSIAGILLADEGHFELGQARPHVLLVVGVNGVGKTTTIGKIAAQFRQRGHKVVLAAGDTFRAAAIEQLEIWGKRAGAAVVRHQHGSDPAAVAYDAVAAAVARGADLVIVDTAGRLHTKAHLMEELKKVSRVLTKALPGAPHEVLLVLDATTGQNAINQAKIFHEATRVDSIALTKLDGTAKGGVIVGICDELKIPVKFIGIGEKVEDLRPFDARAFVEALFQEPSR
ncbi:MAG: signal recognition particle-docking protein FtsY [Thermodesulfobacteriota bacterium]